MKSKNREALSLVLGTLTGLSLATIPALEDALDKVCHIITYILEDEGSC